MSLERIQALTDSRMACYARMSEINRKQEESKLPLSDEDKANFKSAHDQYNKDKAEIDELKAAMDRKHLLEGMDQELYAARQGGRPGPRLIVGDKDMTGADGKELSADELYKKQLQGMTLFFSRKIKGEHLEQYGLSSDSIQQGGVFNPPTQWTNEVLVALRPLSKIRQLARVLPAMPTPGGLGRFTMSAAGRPKRVSEKERAPFDESITFGKREMFTHDQEYTIKIANKLLQVSTMPILSMVQEEAARAFAEEQEYEFILSDGDKSPLGFCYPSDDGVPTSRHFADHGSGTVQSIDAWKKLPKYVHETLRAGGVYIMHTDVQYDLNLKKDTTNQYLWQPSVQAGIPDKFNGYPVITADKMPSSIQTGGIVGAFVNFKEYIILDSSQMDISVEPHLYWETKETGYSITTYNDGQPNRKDAFAISKMS